MNTILDGSIREEIIARINSLQNNSLALWGKMNAYQMMAHCAKWDDMMLSRIQVKQMFLGRLFGKLALRKVLQNDQPLGKNSPTAPELKIQEKAGDFALQKAEWVNRIMEYDHFDNPDFVHPFFGAMTKEQVGQFVYKHHDHHLRQFGV